MDVGRPTPLRPRNSITFPGVAKGVRRSELPLGAARAWHADGVRQVAVPADDAPMLEVLQFASTSYFGYDRHGGVEQLAAMAKESFETWTVHRVLPGSLAGIRAALFFESRRWHFIGDSPDVESETYIRALVSQLRVLGGCTIKPDRDSPCWRIRRQLRRLK